MRARAIKFRARPCYHSRPFESGIHCDQQRGWRSNSTAGSSGHRIRTMQLLAPVPIATASESIGVLRSLGENVVVITASTKKTARKKTKKPSSSTVNINVRNKPLSSLTDEALHSYFANLNGHKPCDLYDFVLREVEKPLF